MNLALFDLDNTLLGGDSDYSWAQFLISKNIIEREKYETQNEQFFADYKAGTLDIHAYHDVQFSILVKHTRQQLEAWRAEYVKTWIVPMIDPRARQKVAEHQQKGDLIAVVTATNSFVTAPIARELGIEHLIATIPAQENGQFTGKIRGIPSFQAGKITRVLDWLESLSYALTSFPKTYFYSDSINDLPLLKIVSNPIVVNPDEKLRAQAEANHWQIIRLHH